MAKLTTYNVTILNWEKHNPKVKMKSGHTHFMLSKKFFSDQKILQLSAIESLFFINLLSIAADLRSDSFVIHSRLLLDSLRLSGKSLDNALIRLQQLQLLTCEKVALNKSELKLILIEEPENSENISNNKNLNSVQKQEAFLKAQAFRDFFREKNLYGRVKIHITQLAEDWGTVENLRAEMNRLFSLEIIAGKSESEKLDFVLGKLIKTAQVPS